jgi:hypothetical protein
MLALALTATPGEAATEAPVIESFAVAGTGIRRVRATIAVDAPLDRVRSVLFDFDQPSTSALASATAASSGSSVKTRALRSGVRARRLASWSLARSWQRPAALRSSTPGGLVIALFVLALELVVAWSHRDACASMLQARTATKVLARMRRCPLTRRRGEARYRGVTALGRDSKPR